MTREYCDYIGEDADKSLPGVHDIPDRELLRRAVNAARSDQFRKGSKHPRWVAIKEVFQLGSTYSWQLCRRFGLDGDEEVKR